MIPVIVNPMLLRIFALLLFGAIAVGMRMTRKPDEPQEKKKAGT